MKDHTTTTNPVIVIPAYDPGDALLPLVRQLSDGLQVVIVDDGSSADYAPLFDALRNTSNVTVLRHAVNLGKGQALKSAFNYILLQFRDDLPGVVTADADGQHLPEDIEAVAHELQANPNEFILGTRDFQGQVPWRSRFGNGLTRRVFRVLLGVNLNDTQTGLRGIPRYFLPQLLQISLPGYDYELDMLIMAVREGIAIREVPIQTVYTNDNAGSHFDPWLDSLRVYFVFLRFSTLGLVTATVDFSTFIACYWVTSNILLSMIIAGIFAGAVSFVLNRTLVFLSPKPVSSALPKYVLLAIAQRAVAYALLTSMVVFLDINVYASKLLAETILVLASFSIQRLFIFGWSRLAV